LLHLDHAHPRGRAHQVSGETFTCRVEVLDQDKGCATVGGHGTEEFLEGVESTRGGTDADDREHGRVVRSAGCTLTLRSRGTLPGRRPLRSNLAGFHIIGTASAWPYLVRACDRGQEARIDRTNDFQRRVRTVRPIVDFRPTHR